jgi:hypothetical protein
MLMETPTRVEMLDASALNATPMPDANIQNKLDQSKMRSHMMLANRTGER